MDKIIVLIGSLGLIGFIYWFFLGEKNEKETEMKEKVEIKVAGGYSPALVKVPAGKQIKLIFTRTDPTDCLEELYIPDLKIKKTLPLNEAVEINLKIHKPGSFEWHCGMNMFKGKLIAV